jgi:hypothetical protein
VFVFKAQNLAKLDYTRLCIEFRCLKLKKNKGCVQIGMNGGMDEWMDGWMDRLMDIRFDGWVDGWIGKSLVVNTGGIARQWAIPPGPKFKKWGVHPEE